MADGGIPRLDAVERLRSVPELAARLALGAEYDPDGGVVRFEGRTIQVDPQALAEAVDVARRLPRPTGLRPGATEALALRHAAEELYLEQIGVGRDRPSVLFFPSAAIAAGFYRAKLPCAGLAARGAVVAQWTESLDLGKALRFGALWVHLQAHPAVHAIARAAKERGVKVVFDLDDDFSSVPSWNPASRAYNEEEIRRMWQMVELADAVTVSTPALADVVRGRARRVEVLPNCVPTRVWPERRRRSDGIKRILWAGSPTHAKDLEILAPALLAVMGRRTDVRFVCFGEAPPEVLRPVAAQIDALPFVAFEEYPERLAGVGADVAVCPLADEPFNRSKSAIKALEMMASGHPVLCSPVGEYPAAVRHGETGWLVDDGRWELAIEAAIAAGGAAQKVAAAGQAWVRENRDADANAVRWERLVTELTKETKP